MITEMRTRVDSVWGKTIVIKPDFKVANRTIDVMITEKDVTVWSDDGEKLTIVNMWKTLEVERSRG